MTTSDWVLWGFCTWNPDPIKLTIRSLRECRTEMKTRVDQGWTCGIYLWGVPPDGLRAQAAAGAPDG